MVQTLEERRAYRAEVRAINDPEIEVLHIDELIQRCGYFADGSNHPVSYGCRHPLQKEKERVGRDSHGKCYSWSCPIATALDRDEPLDAKWFRRKLGVKPSEVGDGYVFVDTKDLAAERLEKLATFHKS